MDLSYSREDEAFRAEVRTWLEEHLTGEFAELRGKGYDIGPEHTLKNVVLMTRSPDGTRTPLVVGVPGDREVLTEEERATGRTVR